MSFIMSDASKSKVESLERRIALGAPLALTDEGLMVSAPGEDGTEAWLDPGINEPLGDGQSDVFADAPPVPFAAKSDAFQPAEQDNTSAMLMGTTYSRATVTSVSSAAESIYTNGSAHFAVSSMSYGGAPLPTSATLNWVLEGTASAGADYTGPLTARTVTFPLNSGSGHVDVPFTVVDDTLDEPTETIIPRLTGGSVNNGAIFQIGSPDRQTATLASDDYTFTLISPSSPVTLSVTGTAPDPLEVDVVVEIKRGTEPARNETFRAKIVDQDDCKVEITSPATRQDGEAELDADANGKVTFTVKATEITGTAGTAKVKVYLPNNIGVEGKSTLIEIKVKP